MLLKVCTERNRLRRNSQGVKSGQSREPRHELKVGTSRSRNTLRGTLTGLYIGRSGHNMWGQGFGPPYHSEF